MFDLLYQHIQEKKGLLQVLASMALVSSTNVFNLFLSKFLFLSALLNFLELCSCLDPKYELTTVASHWSSGGATWYGSPDGAGSTGGACGYGDAVAKAPLSSKIAAGNPSLFRSGKGCGTCYQVKCTHHAACSRKPVTVVITDECPGCPYTYGSTHFDLSGTSFGAMAIPSQEDHLRNAGILPIQYARVACEYPGRKVAFHVDAGSNPNYFSVVVEFEDGDGDLADLELLEGGRNGDQWRTMVESWGANWKINSGSELRPPFSIRLVSQYSGKTLVAQNVIPTGWQPGATYRSFVNYR